MKPSSPNLRTSLLRAALLTTTVLPAAAGTLYWDTNGATAASGNAAGTWDTGTNWTADPAGATDPFAWANGESVVFSAGTDGVATKAVTIGGTVATPSILLEETGLVNLTGGSIDITGGSIFNTSVLAATTGRSLTWTSAITGTGPLTLAVNGDLSATGNSSNSVFALTGSNTFTGNVTIPSGVVSTASSLGNGANKVILNGGGLVDPNLNTAFARDLEIGAAGGTIRNYGSVTNFRLQGALTGSGELRRTDGGTTILTGNGAGYTGTFNLLRGTTQIGDGTQTSNPVPNLAGIILGDAAAGSTIRYHLDTSLSLTAPVTFPNTASTFIWQGKEQADTMTLTSALGPNSATGTVRASSGTLAFASGANIKAAVLSVTSTPANNAAAEVGQISIGPGASVSTRFFNIGDGSNTAGKVVQTGGTVTIDAGSTGFRLGHWGNGATPGSSYTLTGGTLDVSATNIALNVGWDGAGTFDVGGTGLAKAWRLYVDAAGVDQPGIVNLNAGGTIEVAEGGIANDGTAGSQINLGGGILKSTASSTWAGPMDLADATTSAFDVGTSTVTQTGVLSGTGNLTVTGAGTLVVNNNSNTFTGTFTRTGGTLAGIGVIPGAPVINGAIAPGPAAGGTGILSFGEFSATTTTLNGNLRMDLDAAANPGSSDLISVFNNLSFGANAVLSPTFNGTPLEGSHTIVSYGGTRNGAPVIDPGLQVRGQTFAIDTASTPGEVKLAVTGTANPFNLVWSGDGTQNAWNVNSTANWTGQKFFQYDTVLFDNSGNNASSIAITGNLTPGSIMLEGSKSYTFAGTGSLTGGSALTKTSSGDLTILNDNALGPIEISAGNIIVGNGGTTGSLGGTAAITLPAGSNLEFNHSNAQTFSRAFNGGSGGTLVKKGAGSLTTSGGFLLLPTNIIVDGGTLTVSTGSFSGNRLEGDGLITVNAGATLLVPAGSAHALGGNNATMTETFIVNGGTITLNQEQYFNKLTLNGATMNGTADARSSSAENLWNVTGTAPTTIACTFTNQNTTNVLVEDVTGSPAPDLLVTSNMGGGGGLIKTGPGTLRSSGASSAFLGALSINEGTFEAASARALGFGGAIGNATVNGTSVATGAVLDINGVTVNEVITLNDGSVLTNTNASTAGGISNGLAGVRVVDVGSGYTAAPTLAFTGGGGSGATATTAVTGGALGTITTTAAGSGYTSAPSVTITGTGTTASALATISKVILNGTSQIGGTGNLSIAAVMEGTGSYIKTGTGSLTISSGASTFTGNVTVESGTLTVSGGSGGTNTGLGANIGSRTITLNGGTLAFGINNVFGGGGTALANLPTVIVNPGTTLTTNNYNVLGPVTLNGGTVTDTRTGTPGGYQSFEFKGPVTTDGFAASLISSTNGFGHHLVGNITFNVADAVTGTDLTVATNLRNSSADNGSAAASLTKTGPGTLALNAVNVYTGTTTVEAGILTGTGSVAGPLTVNAGGTIAPGSGAGNFGAGSTTIAGSYACEIDAGNDDTLAVTGDLTLTGATLKVSAVTAPILPVYVIATYTGTRTGTFATVTGLPSGYSVNYNDSAKQVELTNQNVIPPYNTFETSNGISGAGPATDSDGDGIPNGIEFVLGGDPSGPGSDSNALLPTLTADSTYLNFVYRRSDDSVSYGPFVEYGSALTGWTTAVAGVPAATPVLIVEDNNFYGAGIDRVTVRIPKALASTAKLFARLRINIP